MSMIDYVTTATTKYIEQMPKVQRKKYGQFFTSKETAVFMAELFDLQSVSGPVSILDPGAGSGILSTALIERMQRVASITKIELVCYESDTNILELLRSNLDWVCDHATKKIEYKIISDDYILSQVADYNHMLWESPNPPKFDCVIGNPPYMKIPKDAPEALAMPDVCYGAPNLYFLFASMSLFNLKDAGEMVYIIPRSWTSGAYFKKFRQKFLDEGALEHIHLFVSRDKVFEKESVLQETIIIKAKRTAVKPQNVTITTTQSNADFSQKTVFHVPYDTVVSGEDKYVYLATNAEEVEVLKRLNRLPDTMPRIGLKMKTGLTVDFRNREALRDHADVVLYSEEKNWLYFIESVTSVGPMDAKRIKEIKEMTTGVTAGEIYVTAFLDFKTFKKFSETLAWETEVWIADMPDHMIHLNGDKFLGPR